ncbi:MAG TPA: hypothetical protein VGK24_10275 [Candidatus Angelobacter sp.]|jgi:hypothetical protein
MLTFAIDTSGQSGGITIAEEDAGYFRVIESAPTSPFGGVAPVSSNAINRTEEGR